MNFYLTQAGSKLACATMMIGGSPISQTCVTESAVFVAMPSVGSGAMTPVSRLAKEHKLTDDEVRRLKWVVESYDSSDHTLQLAKEVKDILAARKLSGMAKITTAQIKRIKYFAGKSGLTKIASE